MDIHNLEQFFKRYDLKENQKELISYLNNFLFHNNNHIFLLKGYAGTGKTFITKGLTEYLNLIGRNYILAAPTGKAAKVIEEKTKNKAYTIHKTIYSNKDLKEYKSSEEDRTYKFYFDLVVNMDSNDTVYIIDEASMISNIYNEMEFIRFGSGFLLQDLIKYINIDQNDHHKKIIFIGDNAQLPPISMNFSPALNKKYLEENFGLKTEEFELTEVVRQQAQSGVLQNAFKLRKSLENKIFNQLNIDTSYDDFEHIEHQNFMEKYLEISENKINKDTMIIAYTNAAVKEYNQIIRKHFFNSIDTIKIKDKIILLANHGDFSNGDFGQIIDILSDTEYKSILLKRKNKETNRVEEIKIDLYFRDVVILFKNQDDKFVSHECKIIENLLFSEQANLSSDEHKALYLDFVIRNKHLKANTSEFKMAIKSDPYFNAFKIKFGYAITCHKAQGSEWKNIFLDCSFTQNQLSENYFRWLYTALTRTTNKVYTLHEPHIGLFDTQISEPPMNENEEIPTTPEKINNIFNIQDEFLLSIFEKVTQKIESNNMKIIDIQHKQYQEIYTFESNNEKTKIALFYNKKNIISNITSMETSNLSTLLKPILEPLKNHLLIVKAQNNFSFSEPFLEEFYMHIKAKVEVFRIKIVSIEHKEWMERYIFQRDTEIETLDVYYDKKGKPKISPPKNKSQLIDDILGIL